MKVQVVEIEEPTELVGDALKAVAGGAGQQADPDG